jgi:Subtilase family
MLTYHFYRKGFFDRCLIFIIAFFMQLHITAQKKTEFYQDSLFTKNADRLINGYAFNRLYYIASWQDSIPQQNKIIRQLDSRNAIIAIYSRAAFNLLQQKISIAAATDNWKLSPAAERIVNQNNKAAKQYILTGQDIDLLLTALQSKIKEATILSINRPSHSVLIKTTTKYLRDSLLTLKEIIFADIYTIPHTETGIIGYDRSFHGINTLDYTIPGANGKGIAVGIKEQKMEAADLDIYKRVLPSSIAANSIENHATVISTIIGGAGNSFYDGRGIANACKFFPSSFANLFADDATILNTNKVSVQNHSYGTIVQQFYGAEALSYDVQTWDNKNILHVFSAGNKGLFAATDGRYASIAGYANLTGNFKMAKNIITAGAIDNNGNIPAESSAGPLYDGRIAPQLIALGPNGTSDAAAVVSGSIAVLQQVYADSNSQLLPSASLVKAILYNTAEDIYNTGIDYKTGYGLLNSFAAVKAIQQKKYASGAVAQNQQWIKNITVAANTAQLKITLAWTDTVAAINNNKALINDLDIEVQELNSGIIYKPWVLNTVAHTDSLGKLPTRKRDSLNTAEQVSIQLPAAGIYQIKVMGTNISSSTLAFDIAYQTDTLNTFSFTSPQHASDVNRAENPMLAIKWKTFVADTNQTGNLYISYNNGSNWQLLKASHKIYSNQYSWLIKDTSTTAILKMETAFGNFLSKEFIISKVNRPKVDFICTDSFQLSWSKHLYADGYTIFALVDSAYLKPVRTVTDTVAVFKRLDYPYLVYAVEPVLNNGLKAARSIALNIELQGVHCFYKTLNYNLLDFNNVNLILELSTSTYVDSVAFEQVSAQGQWQQTYGAVQVFNNVLVYNQSVGNLSGGITYFRGRIKLKNGAVIFTDIINVTTSGKKNIVFYPNPASTKTTLRYVLQQGIPADSKLQLFDLAGRLVLNFSFMPGNVDISKLATGVLIYKLLSSDDKILETGKIIVQH